MLLIKVHRDCLVVAPTTVFKSEPLMSDDEQIIIVGFNLTEAENRDPIEAFQKDDPLITADIWRSMQVDMFYKPGS